MANVEIFLLVALLACVVFWFLRRHGTGIVARRGLSIGADLGTLSDQPCVRIRSVATAGPDQVHLVVSPAVETDPDLDLVVSMGEEEFGFGLLHRWQRAGSPLAIVMPPGSRLVRLRSIDDLQPLTLRRVDR